MAKVSVIIPVYNVAPYLEECLQSLARQTFRDAEFILIDDGSTDESGMICDRWSQQDPRFIVTHKENGGVSSARNLGLQLASGAYIGFADGDDWLEPTALQHLSSLLDENPQASISCAGFFEYLSAPDKPAQIRPDSKEVIFGVINREAAIRNLLVRQGCWATVWNKLFRRAFVYTDGSPLLFREDLHYGEDENWVLTLMAKSKYTVFSPIPVYHYRSRPSSISHDSRVTPKVLTILDAYTASIELLHPISTELGLLGFGRKYNDTFCLQVRAYCSNQWDMLPVIRNKLRGTWFHWLCSPYVLPLRKAKVIVVRTMMALHFPASWIRFAFDIKRKQTESAEDTCQ